MEFSPRKSASHMNCCVFGCKSQKRIHPTVRFHHFPRKGESKVKHVNRYGMVEEVDRRMAWVIACRSGKTITKHMTVCSKHFKPNDYFCNDRSKKRYLKKTAVPSLNMPKESFYTSPEKRRPIQRQLIICSWAEEDDRVLPNPVSSPPNEASAGPSTDPDPQDIMSHCLSENELEVARILTTLSFGPHTQDKSSQVSSGDFKFTFEKLIDSDKKLNTLTGIPTLQLLSYLVHFPTLVVRDKRRSHFLTVEQRIILTMMKLKHSLSYSFLGILWNISRQQCQAVFTKMLITLEAVLRQSIRWPAKPLVGIPASFNDFKNTIAVIDCTEIKIETPKCLCCRIRTYSHYKKAQTVKLMSCITPNGIASFVSKAYCGKTSDTSVFKDCGIASLLDKGDAIMVDRGFLVSTNDLPGIEVFQPPFLKGKKQLSPAEADYNRKLAACRVHIERFYQRVKIFKILSEKFPLYLITQLDIIVTIIFGLVNLSPPLIKPGEEITAPTPLGD